MAVGFWQELSLMESNVPGPTYQGSTWEQPSTNHGWNELPGGICEVGRLSVVCVRKVLPLRYILWPHVTRDWFFRSVFGCSVCSDWGPNKEGECSCRGWLRSLTWDRTGISEWPCRKVLCEILKRRISIYSLCCVTSWFPSFFWMSRLQLSPVSSFTWGNKKPYHNILPETESVLLSTTWHSSGHRTFPAINSSRRDGPHFSTSHSWDNKHKPGESRFSIIVMSLLLCNLVLFSWSDFYHHHQMIAPPGQEKFFPLLLQSSFLKLIFFPMGFFAVTNPTGSMILI